MPGTHNAQELELMLRGIKPMANFMAPLGEPAEVTGDANFQPYVEQGRISKYVYRNERLDLECRSYALPTEEWRAKLWNFIYQTSFEGGLTDILTVEDRVRVEGFLLGYSKESTEKHLRYFLSKHQPKHSNT